MKSRRPIRRSQLISPYGIGSIVNFRNDESLMVAGLDAWEEVYNTYDGHREFIINEPRLLKRLNVKELRLPPDYRDTTATTNPHITIPFVIFPRWYYCPYCGTMEEVTLYSGMRDCPGKDFGGKRTCSNKKESKKYRMIPSRFITLCEDGHIDDFPFVEWVHESKNYDPKCKEHMRIQTGRSSSALSGIKLSCYNHDEILQKSMAGSFNKDSLEKILGYTCRGSRPWLGEVDNKSRVCGKTAHVVQRGASNVFFSQLSSSIYLPSHKEKRKKTIIKTLDKNWNTLISGLIDNKINEALLKMLADQNNLPLDELKDAASEKLAETLDQGNVDDITEEQFRRAEYEKILNSSGDDNDEFYAKNIQINHYEKFMHKYFKSISLVYRLRETRAFYGFSRWTPDNNRTIEDFKSQLIKNGHTNWLPAIITKGEGIFFEFNEELIRKWSINNTVSNRTSDINENYNRMRSEMGMEDRQINARFILIHTFAHVMINQLAIFCGYGSSSIRERLYIDSNIETPENPMNGLLLYTASGDAEGSLGGLVNQGISGNLEKLVYNAIESISWCSSDPICIESKGQGPSNTNMAACHNCCLLPETSCEEGNKLLDRALIIEKDNIGYFQL